jgi:hypothetical protein
VEWEPTHGEYRHNHDHHLHHLHIKKRQIGRPVIWQKRKIPLLLRVNRLSRDVSVGAPCVVKIPWRYTDSIVGVYCQTQHVKYWWKHTTSATCFGSSCSHLQFLRKLSNEHWLLHLGVIIIIIIMSGSSSSSCI